MHRPHKESSFTPFNEVTLEDIERDIQDLRSFGIKLKPSQDTLPANLETRKISLNRRHEPNSPFIQDGHKYASEEDNLSFNFARADNQIRGINDELLRDYSTDMLIPKTEKLLENLRLKMSTGAKMSKYNHSPDEEAAFDYSDNMPEPKATLEYSGQLSGDKSASKYSGLLPDGETILKYHEKLPDHESTKEQSRQLITSSMGSQYEEHLAGDKATTDSVEQVLDNTGVPGYQRQMSNAAATQNNVDQQTQIINATFPNEKNFSTSGNIIDGYSSERTNDFNSQKQNNLLSSPTSNTDQHKDENNYILQQLQLEIDSLKNRKKANVLNEDTIPNTGNLWPQSNEYPSTLEQEVAGNFMIRNNKPVLSSKTTPQTDINKNKSVSVASTSNKEMKIIPDNLERNTHTTPAPINFTEKIRERVKNKNQVIQNRNINETKRTDENVSNSDTSKKQKSVTADKTNETHSVKYTIVKDSQRLSNDRKGLVSIEKRKGDMAGKYRNKNTRKPNYKPRPPQRAHVAAMRVTKATTTEEPTTANMTAFVNTTETTERIMQEIIDRGPDKIDIPLSGSPPWHARIHGRRDIVLAGAIMGGIGLLLIILSIVYIVVNRRSSGSNQQQQTKTRKNDKKTYKKLGSSDEKVGLTEPQHSLFPLSSDEFTTDESDDEKNQSQAKKGKAITY